MELRTGETSKSNNYLMESGLAKWEEQQDVGKNFPLL